MLSRQLRHLKLPNNTDMSASGAAGPQVRDPVAPPFGLPVRPQLASITTPVFSDWHPFLLESPAFGAALAAAGGHAGVAGRVVIDAFLVSIRDLLLDIWPGGRTTLLSGICVAHVASNEFEEFLHPAPPSAAVGHGPAPAPPVARELVLGLVGLNQNTKVSARIGQLWYDAPVGLEGRGWLHRRPLVDLGARPAFGAGSSLRFLRLCVGSGNKTLSRDDCAGSLVAHLTGHASVRRVLSNLVDCARADQGQVAAQALVVQPTATAPVLPRSADIRFETTDVDDYLNMALQLCFEKSLPGGTVFDTWAQPAEDFLSSLSIRYWIAHRGSVRTHLRSLWRKRQPSQDSPPPCLIDFLEVACYSFMESLTDLGHRSNYGA